MSERGKIVLAMILFAGFAAFTIGVVMVRKKPEKESVKERVTLVAVQQARAIDIKVEVEAGGTVMPAREVRLAPQVSGQVVSVSDRLIPGGLVAEDEILVQIEPRDFELVVVQREAELERARLELKDEQGRRAIAEREWNLLGSELETTEEGKALALREPQLRRAEANLKAAQSNVARAELDLKRAAIRVPFNSVVRNESVDVGQWVSPQMSIVTLVGVDMYWIQASVPVDKLAFFEHPNHEGLGGAFAWITHEAGSTQIRRKGRIIRLLADLEQSGRMARVLIAVNDPLGLAEEAGQAPLLLGAYVRVEIGGKELKQVFQVPSEALREGQHVWIVNDQERLEIRPVNVAWVARESVLIGTGLKPGERIVVSRIATPIPGMKLSVPSEEGEATDDANERSDALNAVAK